MNSRKILRSVFFAIFVSCKTIVTTSLSSKSSIVPSGVVAIFKPKGYSSAGVVGKIKYILVNGEKQALNIPQGTKYKSKIKVGHGGTLDPLAEGVLVLGIGDGTKQLQEYLSGNKGWIKVINRLFYINP